MRVALLTQWWPEKSHEGIFVKDQADALRAAGHDVQPVYIPTAKGPRLLRYARFHIEAGRQIDWLHKQVPFDIIHSHEAFPCGWVGNQFAQANGIASVITQHCWPLPCSNDWTEDATDHRWLEGRYSRQALEQADGVMAVSDYLRRRMGLGEVVPLIVDRRFYHLLSWPGAGPSSKRFLYTGSLCQRKGVDAILDAIVYLHAVGKRGWEFILQGDGPLWSEAIARTRGLTGVRVEPPGGREAVLKRMAWCDVFVFPSRGEGFGLAGVEAAVAGRPVICGEGTATHEILGPSANPVKAEGGAIADAMFSELRLPDTARLYRRHNSEAVVSQIEAVYRKAIERSRRKRLTPDLLAMEASG